MLFEFYDCTDNPRHFVVELDEEDIENLTFCLDRNKGVATKQRINFDNVKSNPVIIDKDRYDKLLNNLLALDSQLSPNVLMITQYGRMALEEYGNNI